MSALRYSGEIRIRITYLAPYLAGDIPPAGRSTLLNGEYRCFLRGPDGMTATIVVRAPVYLSHAVDSPRAFDDAAKAALAFAVHDDKENDWSAFASFDDSGFFVSREAPAYL